MGLAKQPVIDFLPGAPAIVRVQPTSAKAGQPTVRDWRVVAVILRSRKGPHEAVHPILRVTTICSKRLMSILNSLPANLPPYIEGMSDDPVARGRQKEYGYVPLLPEWIGPERFKRFVLH